MSYSKSAGDVMKTSISARMARSARNSLICLLSALLLLTQTVVAAPPVSKQLRKFPIGATLQVHMADGRILEGTLVSSSAAGFELLQPGHESAEAIEDSDVKAVNQTGASPRRKRTWITVAIVAGALAAAGFGASRAGGLY